MIFLPLLNFPSPSKGAVDLVVVAGVSGLDGTGYKAWLLRRIQIGVSDNSGKTHLTGDVSFEAPVFSCQRQGCNLRGLATSAYLTLHMAEELTGKESGEIGGINDLFRTVVSRLSSLTFTILYLLILKFVNRHEERR